jgi:hypothetical protein
MRAAGIARGLAGAESQGGCTQQGWQQGEFIVAESALFVVGGHEGLCPCCIQLACGQVNAPVVQAHRDVKAKGVAASEVKVEKS